MEKNIVVVAVSCGGTMVTALAKESCIVVVGEIVGDDLMYLSTMELPSAPEVIAEITKNLDLPETEDPEGREQ